MTPDDRRRLRAALSIHDHMTDRDGLARPPLLPLDGWRDLERATLRVALAEERGWAAAAAAARREHRRLVESLIGRLTAGLADRERAGRPRRVQSPREILADLAALEDEFGDVEVDLREQTVSVTTDPVVLEGVNLGRFELALRWDLEPDSGAYSAIALDPNPAGEDETTTHPHVREEALCEGDGRHAIRRALEEGRLLDFFLLVRGVLTTYNPGSAYVPLSRWDGAPCADCGVTAPDGESDRCERCGDDLCPDCSSSCRDCGRTCCGECRESCGGCEDALCPSCLAACGGCGSVRCRDCLDAGLCGDCRDDDSEPETEPEPVTEDTCDERRDEIHDGADGGAEDEAGDAAEAAAPPPGGPAVHALRLGEALVSA